MVIALGLIKQGNDYLLQLRDNKPVIGGAGLIGCFGGKIEANESPNQAVSREIAEETNLKSLPEDWREVGEVSVTSDHKLETVKVKIKLFEVTVPKSTIIEAREGTLVKMTKQEATKRLAEMTTGTRAYFKKYILGD